MDEITQLKEFVKKANKRAKYSIWTQERIAKEIGVSLHTINRWFNGRSDNPNQSCRILIRQFLDNHYK